MLKYIKLINIGQHRRIELDLSKPIVGIIGKSGSGKSTILEAIDFALTGTLPDKNVTWIRSGQKSGTVELSFSSGNVNAVITRNITSSGATTRQLVIEGEKEVLKSAAEVDEKLLEIFGTNLKSKTAVAFVKQGTIGQLINSTASERLDILCKLLDLTYLEKRSREVMQIVKTKKANFVDLVPNYNICVQRLADLERSIHDTDLTINQSFPNIENEYNFISEIYAELLTSDNDEAKSNRLITELADLANNLDRKRKLYDERKALLESKIELNKKVYDVKKEYDELIRNFNIRNGINEILNTYPYIEESATVIGGLENKITVLTNKINSFAVLSNLKKEEEQLLSSLNKIINKKTEYTELLARYEYDIDSINLAIHSKRKNLAEHKAVLAQIKPKIELLTKIHSNGCSDNCSICGCKLHPDNIVEQSFIDSLKELEKSESDICNNIESQIVKFEADIVSIQKINTALVLENEKENSTTRLLTEYKEKIQLIDKDNEISALDIEKVRVEIDTKKKLRESLSNSYIEYRNLKKNYSYVDDDLDDKVNEVSESYNKLTASFEVINSRIATLNFAEQDYLNVKKNYDTLSSEIERIKKNRMVREEKIKGLKNDNQEIENAISNRYISIHDAYRDIKLNHSVYLTLRDDKKLLVAQYNSLFTEAKQLEEKIEENSKAKKIIEEIEAAGVMLSKEGIISFVVAKIFRDIIKATSVFLKTLDSNIDIREENGTSCGIEFRRLDIDKDVWLPVRKMSGGEKVKTGTAMIFAMNAITAPDFGIVILDEPSTHLCEYSKQSLLSLIETGLRSTGFNMFQTIIVDHSEILIPGFDIVHELK